jgi:hypothetical protein
MEPVTATRLAHSIAPCSSAVTAIREGDAVLAEDGMVGRIDRLILSETHVPVYLVVRAGRTLRRRYPVVSVSLVTAVDASRSLVRLRGRCRQIGRLPETLPLLL